MKKVIISLLAFVAVTTASLAQHGLGTKGKVLLIASNPAKNPKLGWPIGAWAAEIVHPYWEFINNGYAVDIVSPDGGEVKFDGFSDPDDASKYAAWDVLSLGFKKDERKMALLKNTPKLSSVNPNDYKAIMVAGGQGPMVTFIDNAELQKFFTDFYQTGKPTAVICHGTCILLKTKLPNGKYLVDGKKWTGFANTEENYADAFVGQKIQPFRIEDEARKMPNSKFEVGEPFGSHAVQDGNLITGQQQNSGAEAAHLVIDALEKDRSRYPTYVLVHGAWASDAAWDGVRNQLAQNANVTVVNLPAHGTDNTWSKMVHLTDYVKIVSEAVKAAPGKVTLVGHSMAGMVVSQVAENMPEKLHRLVYVSAYLPKDGQKLMDLARQDKSSLVGANLEYPADYEVAIKKDIIGPGVCADCPNYVKEMLVKYHRAEPAAPLNTPVKLTAKFASVPKYYILTTQDKAVGTDLQRQMVKANGTVKQVYEMNTSHLPFMVQPDVFIKTLTGIY